MPDGKTAESSGNRMYYQNPQFVVNLLLFFTGAGTEFFLSLVPIEDTKYSQVLLYQFVLRTGGLPFSVFSLDGTASETSKA